MKMENYIKHILTIEDNREFWETLAELFRPDPSYQFTFVDDGNEGCNMLLSKPFDLAIIDLGLPGKPGREIVNDAKFAGVKTPMLVLTANEDERSESDNMNDGAVDYVRKSSAHHVIVSRIKAAIRNSTSDDRPVIPFGKCAYDTTCDTIIGPKPKQRFDLPPKPARVLETLMRSKSHGMRAQSLIAEVWKYDGKVKERTLNRNVNLVNEIFEDHGLPRIIRYVPEKECYELIRN